jgi:hypothetical protein
MRKLLFLAVVLFGGAMFLKSNASITPDNQVRVASWTFPIPAAVQNSPVMGLVNTMLLGRLDSTGPTARPGGATPPSLPVVTTANGTYDANRPSTGRPQSADQFNAAAKALRGSQ